jgi:hypothetical protein
VMILQKFPGEYAHNRTARRYCGTWPYCQAIGLEPNGATLLLTSLIISAIGVGAQLFRCCDVFIP